MTIVKLCILFKTKFYTIFKVEKGGGGREIVKEEVEVGERGGVVEGAVEGPRVCGCGPVSVSTRRTSLIKIVNDYV